MSLEIGDKVSILDENAKGIIVKICQNSCEIDIEGFIYTYPFNKVVKQEVFSLGDAIVIKDQVQADVKIEGPRKIEYNKKLRGNVLIIDLHFHEISGFDHWESYRKLRYQLDYFLDNLEWYIDHKLKKFIVVHGKGSGILKTEIIKILKGYDKLRFHDAPYSEGGATEIIFL